MDAADSTAEARADDEMSADQSNPVRDEAILHHPYAPDSAAISAFNVDLLV